MELEFEIGETDYNVVWSMNNIAETGDNADDIMEENVEIDSILQDETNKENTNKENLKKSEEEEGKDMGHYSDPKQENIEKVEESDKKQNVFGQHANLFRESWGLPPAAPEKDSSSDDEESDEVISVKQTIEANGEKIEKEVLIPMDEEEAEKGLVFTTVIKVTKGKGEKDIKEDIQEVNVKYEDNSENQDEEDMEQSYKEALTKGAMKCDDSTEANFYDNSEDKNMVSPTKNHPEAKEFTIKLGAGQRSIKLSRKSWTHGG